MSDYIEKFYQADVKRDSKGKEHFLSLSSIKKTECYLLYNVIKKYRPIKTLEIGFALGASAVGIIAGKVDSNIQEKHIVLDPFQKIASNNVGLLGITDLQLDSKLVLLEKYSEIFLSELSEKKEYFDFIFIDGNHTIGQAVTDAFLADRILNTKGIIGIHDSLLFSTAASIKYLLLEKGYSLISKNIISLRSMGRQVKYVRKLGVWYCKNVIPSISSSIIFVQKN